MSGFSDFHSFMAAWISAALASAFPQGAPPIVRAYANAAKPAGVYIAIETDAKADPFGQPYSEVRALQDGTPSAIVQTEFARSPAIWEIGAHGEYLEAIVASRASEMVRAMFRKSGVSLLSVGDILSMPYSAPGAEITREHRLQLEMSTSTQIVDTDATYIEVVEKPSGTFTI